MTSEVMDIRQPGGHIGCGVRIIGIGIVAAQLPRAFIVP